MTNSSSSPTIPTNPTQPVTVSPILTNKPLPSATLPPSQPEYAEVLTPLKLRRRRRHAQLSSSVPLSVQPGPSKYGFTTEEGEIYRGATYDPRFGAPAIDDDALTIGGSSSTSSSSSWSWASDIQRGRRATMAVIGRFGEAIGVRRGSSDGGSTAGTSIRRSLSRRSRRLSRVTTKDSQDDKPKRQYIPRKREFTLLIPPRENEQGERVISTPELGVVLDHVRNLRAARGIFTEVVESRKPSHRPKLRQVPGSFNNPPVPRVKSRLDALRGDVPRPKSVSDLMGMMNPYDSSTSLNQLKTPSRSSSIDEQKGKGCWWLDVSCPGWEDLRDIGELLGLHPLTLEDVLQQDPREKFDIFDRLGYYLVVVRALDEEYFRYTPGSNTSLVGGGEKVVLESPNSSPQLRANNEKKKEGRRRGWGMGRATGKTAHKEGEKVEIVEDNPGKEGLEGVGVGALNVYLVVFADGIVSFHYENITKHTKRVMERILSHAGVENPGSDWIAHGLLDSIVDAFFPIIRYVDGEVDDIDSLTVDPSTDPRAHSTPPEVFDAEGIELTEKGVRPAPRVSTLRKVGHALTIPPILLPRWFIYVRLFFLPAASATSKKYDHPDNQVMSRQAMLRHMTHMRKLVSGLTKLLGTKHQVVGLLRKRVADNGQGIDAYIGDVEDHILLLQNSLQHYEYILSHCQPAYLSHLNLGFQIARGRADRGILALSTVGIGILPMTFVISMFSINVHVPHNGDPDNNHDETDGSPAPFNYFIGIVCSLILISCGVVFTVRYWRLAAKKKWARIRNAPEPDTWNAFWGF